MTSVIKGNKEKQKLKGTNDDDTLAGMDGDDLILAYKGNDTVYGGNGNDVLYGGAGDDVLYGGAGDDTLNAGDGSNTLKGGAGNDRLILHADSPYGNTIDGGDGNDTADYSSTSTSRASTYCYYAYPVRPDLYPVSINGIVADLAAEKVIKVAASSSSQASFLSGPFDVVKVENIVGTIGSDMMTGNDGDNVLDSGGGSGFNGKDINFDVLSGEDGNDTLISRNASGVYFGNMGNDTFKASEYNGHDRQFNGGDDTDTADYSAFKSGVLVRLAVDPATQRGKTVSLRTRQLIDTLNSVEAAIGSAFADELRGNAKQSNTLSGGDGDDLLVGGNAGDVLNGGMGNDKLIGGKGNDNFIYRKGDGADTIVDAGGQNILNFLDLNSTEVAASKVGESLKINVLTDTTGSVTISSNNVGIFKFADKTLNLNQLLQASAAFAPPSAAASQSSVALAGLAGSAPIISPNNSILAS